MRQRWYYAERFFRKWVPREGSEQKRAPSTRRKKGLLLILYYCSILYSIVCRLQYEKKEAVDDLNNTGEKRRNTSHVYVVYMCIEKGPFKLLLRLTALFSNNPNC